jgi:ATP-dependent DNA ligase
MNRDDCCTCSTSTLLEKELFSEICRCDLQGIVAKRKTGMYREDRPDWLKIKNRTYSQAEGRHELLTRARKKN